MAGNEEHPFASIVAAYRESQEPAVADVDEASVEAEPAAAAPAADPAAEPVAETSIADFFAAQTAAPAVAAEVPVPEPEAPAADLQPELPLAEAEPEPEPVVAEPELPVAETPVATPPTSQAPTGAASDSILAAYFASQTTPAAPLEVPVVEDLPDAEKPSALIDPSKSILAAYYAQSAAEDAAAAAEPEPAPAEAGPAAVDAVETEVPVAAAEEPPVAEPEVEVPAEAAAIELPVDEPEAELPTEEPVAAEAPVEEAPAPAAGWARASAAGAATGAAASVLAAYYADAHPDSPVVEEEPVEAVSPAAEIVAPAAEVAAPATALVDDITDTAVLPIVASTGFPASPSNPLGVRPLSGDWGAQALMAAGSSTPMEPMEWKTEDVQMPAAVQAVATEDVEHHVMQTKDEPSEARRKFFMLAPIGGLAAAAVVGVLLVNGGGKDNGAPAPTQTPTVYQVNRSTPLKATQEAYANALDRFTKASDAGGAVAAGGAAHDTLKLLADFKGASAADKALLAAERAHLTSLAGLASTDPGNFANIVERAHKTLTNVDKAASADAKAGTASSADATNRAIDLLAQGNVSKLQSTLNGLVARADSASLTSHLRSVAGDAADGADAARNLASVDQVSSEANALAGKFASLAPMSRINGDNLDAWSGIRSGVVNALGNDPTAHIDTLIANAKQKIATWQANQGDTAAVTAINNYASGMRSHFSRFGGALSQIPSLSAGQKGSSAARGQAGNAYTAVNSAAFGGNPPQALLSAHNALVDAINAGTRAATAARNVTVFCSTSNCTYGQQGDWGTYSANIWVKGGWGGKVSAWESAVSNAIAEAKAKGPKPVV